MNEAIERGDAEALAQNVHKLKGSVSYFTGDPVIAVAVDVDAAARDGDIAAVRARMPELEDLLRDLGRRLSEASAEMKKDAR
jgi:hypothetical protein